MKTEQHTPGHWNVISDAKTGRYSMQYADGREFDANARLIQLAPELLSLLEDCEQNMIISTSADMRRLDKIRALIAKACGE